MEDSRIKIAADRTAADAEDPKHWDKLPRNTRAASAAGKASSSRQFTQDWSDDDSDEDCQMFICPTPLAYALPETPLAYAIPEMPLAYAFPMPSLVISDEVVVNTTPLNQGPPSTGGRGNRKRGIKPQPEKPQQPKRQKVGVSLPKKPRPIATG
jgi:hypothetical protein